jgi:hypothetical protein
MFYHLDVTRDSYLFRKLILELNSQKLRMGRLKRVSLLPRYALPDYYGPLQVLKLIIHSASKR